MSEKHILLADPDANTTEEFRQALGQEWTLQTVAKGAAALQELKTSAYDGLVVSLHLGDMTPAQLLNRVRNKYPKIVRFIVATEQDRKRVVKEVLGAHQFIIRPFDSQALKTTIKNALGSERWIENEQLQKLISRMRTLPAMPALYLEIVAALRSPNTTIDEVGSLIAQDMAITTKLLQVINSAYFGLPRTVTSPSEAISLLGFETAKSMVLGVKLLNQYDRIKTGEFSIDGLWQHCTDVAHNARRLVLLQTGDRTLAEEAFAAGLLHDVGKAVLAGNFGEQYAGAESLARKQELAVCEVEKEIFGATHGEVGAYLLSLWGLPNGVLEATALHHEPGRSADQSFTILTAVHVANALQYVADKGLNEFVAPKIDLEYLGSIGMRECLPAWCEELLGAEVAASYLAARNPQPNSAAPQGDSNTAAPSQTPSDSKPTSAEKTPDASDSTKESKERAPTEDDAPAEEDAPAEATAKPVCETDEQHKITYNEKPTSSYIDDLEESEAPVPSRIEAEPKTESQPELSPANELAASIQLNESTRTRVAGGKRTRWVITAGVVLALLAILLVWQFAGERKPAVTVQAHEVNQDSSVAAPPASASANENANAPAPTETSEQQASNSTPTAATAPETVVSTNANKSADESLSADSIFPKLKLQGILFTPGSPTAIINGSLVRPKDRLEGVRIVEIRPASVTVEFKKERKVLLLQ